MNNNGAIEMEMEELYSIRVEEPISTKKYSIKVWFQRLITLDGILYKKHHRPIFIIIMTILHILIHLLVYININWKGQTFAHTLFDLFKFFLPCMRPTSYDIRMRIVNCLPSMKNGTCYYDDVLKYMCFSFTYPHQLWRIITVNLLHLDWLHLLSNLAAQIVQGIPLERKYGSICIFVIFWLSEVGASLSFMSIHEEESGVGASGAIYGLMLFLIMDRLIAIQSNTGHRLFIIIQLALLLLPFVIINIPLMIKYTIAHSAHIGGGLVGYLIGVIMLGCPCSWINENSIRRKICQRIAFILLFLYYLITFIIFFLKDVPLVHSIVNNF